MSLQENTFLRDVDPSLYSAHKKLETCTIDPPLSDHFLLSPLQKLIVYAIIPPWQGSVDIAMSYKAPFSIINTKREKEALGYPAPLIFVCCKVQL